MPISDGDIKTAVKMVQDLLAISEHSWIRGIVMLVALDDGTYKSCDAFDDDANTNAILMSFIAHLVKLHDKKHGGEPSPSALACPTPRIVN
jgi:hypothetical protein